MKLIRDEVNSKQLDLSEEFKITEEDLAEWAGKTDASEDSNRKGDLAEYYAVTWLWDNGYEVFQNSGCTGPIDMIAMDKKGDITLIDVKTFCKRYRDDANNDISAPRTKKQKEMGVKVLGFNPTNRELRFVEHTE